MSATMSKAKEEAPLESSEGSPLGLVRQTSASPSLMQGVSMVNRSRPSSVASTHSNASSGGGLGAARTTTSRRGGRTRSRSPASLVVGRGEPVSLESRELNEGYRPQVNGSTMEDRHGSPANPSGVAAAAAAAAAKALSNTGRKTSWYENSGEDRRSHESGRFSSGESFPGQQRSSSRQSWPREKEGAQPRSSARGGGVEENFSRRNGEHRGIYGPPHQYSQGDRSGRAVEQVRPYEGDRAEPYSDRRYRDQGNRAAYDRPRAHDRRPPSGPQGTYDSHRNTFDQRSGGASPEYYKSPPAGMAPMNDDMNGQAAQPFDANRGDRPYSPKSSEPTEVSTPSTVKRAGGTSRVMGTPTPIHVPRAGEPPLSSRHQVQDGSAASVFRGRPGGGPSNGASEVGDDTPQKLLLSLRTPTTSFEEGDGTQQSGKRRMKGVSQGGPPMSPQEPPQIQHQHQMSPNSLFFEPQRSPKQQGGGPAGGIEMDPSFSLFNQSFDSLGDANYLNVSGPLDPTLHAASFGGPIGSNENDQLGAGYPPQGPGQAIHRDMSLNAGSFGVAPSYNHSFSASPGGPGGSMNLMLGMSPANSFGNGPPGSARQGGMMLLGGQGARSNSPTAQVLGMYPSYSGTYEGQMPQGNGGPFRSPRTDGHMGILSSGSFGGPLAPSLSQVYARSGAEASPTSNYQYQGALGPDGSPSDGPEGTQNPRFYFVLRSHRRAFESCSFVLPGLKAALEEARALKESQNKSSEIIEHVSGVDADAKTPPAEKDQDSEEKKTDVSKAEQEGGETEPEKAAFVPQPSNTPPRKRSTDPSPSDLEVATRRVASAICAFGGTCVRRVSTLKKIEEQENQSIFRDNEITKETENEAPSSTAGTGSTPTRVDLLREESRAKRYEEQLAGRYYENDNRLSWEFEENPLIGDDDESKSIDTSEARGDNSRNGGEDSHEGSDTAASASGSTHKSSPSNDGNKKSNSPSANDQPKMRYRCKLCGQPKQNHSCPYQQSLQRSIGIMVYPAVNAFTSNEPGYLAPALSEMNNFISSGSEPSSASTSPSRPTPERLRAPHNSSSGSGPGAAIQQNSQLNVPRHVTPETLRSAMPHQDQMNSPGSSSLSTGSATPQSTPYRRTPGSSSRRNGMTPGRHQHLGGAVTRGTPGSRRKKRAHSQLSGDSSSASSDFLFVDAVELKPEQYRIVTPSRITSLPGAYKYPALPLPYAQRKRLSDNLFALSKEVPQLTDECAVVLREAREKDMWDVAVAELMTQVIVVLHCPERDHRFEGLRQYLLTVGIAC